MLRDARRHHKDIIEQNYMSMELKRLREYVVAITNLNTTKKCLITDNDLGQGNKLNNFFLGFEKMISQRNVRMH